MDYIRLTPGTFWTNCRFVFADSSHAALRGISNGQASRMQAEVGDLTRNALANAFSPAFLDSFYVWFGRGRLR